jgi:hypothetical protein
VDTDEFEKAMTTDDSDIEMVDTFDGNFSSRSSLLDPDPDEANGPGVSSDNNFEISSISSEDEEPTDLPDLLRKQPAATSSKTGESGSKTTAASSIRKGLTMLKDEPAHPHGLFRFFRQGSREEFRQKLALEGEKMRNSMEDIDQSLEEANLLKKANTRERARLRKEQSRRMKKNLEIKKGLRSPGGTKRRVCLHFVLKISY